MKIRKASLRSFRGELSRNRSLRHPVVPDAEAANVVVYPNADISTAPYVISLDGGAATFTFTDITSTVDTYIDAVSTSGNALVDFRLGSSRVSAAFPAGRTDQRL